MIIEKKKKEEDTVNKRGGKADQINAVSISDNKKHLKDLLFCIILIA